MQITTIEPGPVTPTSPPLDRLATQVGAPPTQTPFDVSQPVVSSISTEPEGLLYFWPTSLSADAKFNSANFVYNNNGYVIEFDNFQTGASTILRAGTEADRYSYCAGMSMPDQIRGMDGCYSMGTGAGAIVEWRENGIRYSTGGIGNSMEAVLQFAENLEVLDYQTWQQRITNATKLPSPSHTRIEFISGTTSHKSDLQELANGDSDEYILGALAGQELTVSIPPDSSPAEGFVLNISGADGSVLVSESAQTNLWTGTLPATQDYIIRVTNQGNTAYYQLQVNIPARIKLTAGETSNTLQGRLVIGLDSNTYLLQAQAGQTLTVTTTSPNNNACLTITTRMTDGTYVPLVNAASHPTTTWSAMLPSGPDYSQDYSISVSRCPETPVANTYYTLFVNITN
jgi:hypothetical protein